MNSGDRQDFWKPKKPSYKRRMRNHDYQSRCIYMVTINKADGIPPFSELQGKVKDVGNPPRVKFTRVGEAINFEIKRIKDSYPQIYIPRYVIMPDHLHLLIFVKEPIPIHLGAVISAFKVNCAKRLGDEPRRALFDANFHDRILRGKGQLKAMNDYISDNPRRLLIKREFPQLFRRVLYLKILNIEDSFSGGMTYAIYGNPLLLEEPVRTAVKVSRKYSLQELESREREWNDTIDDRGVLISPFINPKEKVFRDRAIDMGAGIILIMENGFGERFAPQGKWFDLCASYRLLMVAPVKYETEAVKLSYSKAQGLNKLAEMLASQDLKFEILKNLVD